MGLKSFPDNNVKEKIWGVNMCFGQYKSGKRKVRYIVSTMYYKKKYSIMVKPANKQHSLLYKCL